MTNIKIFIHIPKTAGTSFRKALEKKENVVCDYGIKAVETDIKVRKLVYKKPDFLSLYKTLQKENCWLVGHMPINKYLNFSEIKNTFFFVREPIAQVLSHFNHFKSYYNKDIEFDKFVNNEQFKNIQSKYTNGLPLGLVGFIGITEHYNQSLEYINAHLGTHIEFLNENINEQKTLLKSKIAQNQIDLILENNKQDCELYAESMWLFEQRIKFKENDTKWTYHSLGVNKFNVVIGCAFQVEIDEAVELVLYQNDKEIKTVIANEFFGQFVKAKLPRERFVGFRFRLPEHCEANDYFDIYVKNTMQKLNFHRIVKR